ncbi:hypothetical protein CRI94_07725 [Longibacter salinarum]|uniref:DUF3592 domain-containing protein n=1 Tax=Longibacter salinarum TaxID=1850348 RepID=A0A2A8CZ18_9BACT|nr:hypothetical protein [Longibacter salinarum]PEN13935.1 hypothetical protein CRI94_07725 [Longibacter salinarum]
MRISLPFASQIGRIFSVLFSLVFIGAGLAVMFFVPAESASGDGFKQYIPYAFGGIFVLAGIFSLISSIRKGKQQAEANQMLEKHSDEPWKVRPEWRSSEIVGEGSLSRSEIFFTIIWNVIAWPLAYFMISKANVAEEGAVIYLVLLFPLIGLGFLGKVVYNYLQMRKFGTTILEMESMPGRLGERLSGVLKTGMSVDGQPENGFEVEISCYRQYVRYTRDSDGDRKKKIERDLLWRDEARVRGQAYGDGTKVQVPFSFQLPTNQPASSPMKTERRKLWEVSIEADVPGIDLSDKIEIPVFESEGTGTPSQPTSPADGRESTGEADGEEAFTKGDGAPGSDSAVSAAVDQADEAPAFDEEWEFDEPVTKGITIEDAPGKFEMHFGSSRNRSGGLTLGLIGLAMVIGGFFLFGASFLFALIMVGLGGLMVYGAVQNLTNDTVVWIRNGQIEVTHDGMGMPDDVAFPASELEDVMVRLDSTNQSSGYGIFLVASESADLGDLEKKAAKANKTLSNLGVSTSNPMRKQMKEGMEKPHVRVANQLEDKAEADWLAQRIKEAAEREASF